MPAMPAGQPSLFDASPPPLQGLRFEAGFLTPEEEAALASRLADLPLEPFAFGPYTGKREVASFGWRYDYGEQSFEAARPIPDFLRAYAARAEAWAGLPAGEVAQALVTRYDPGVTIGWHRDKPHFAEVIGVSLLSPATMRFRRRDGAGWAREKLPLPPRSIYLLSGEARSAWEHSIPPVAALRYSLTFRRLSPRGRAAAGA